MLQFLVAFLFLIHDASACIEFGTLQEMLFDQLAFGNASQKLIRPSEYGEPTKVNVSLLFENIGPLDESQLTIHLNLYFRQRWKDERLRWDNYNLCDPDNYDSPLILTLDTMDNVWMPDTYFVSAQQASEHDLTIVNAYVWVYSTGEVLLSQKYSVENRCPLKLQLYPMDTQICQMVMESFGHSTKELVLSWMKSFEIQHYAEGLQLPQFYMDGLEAGSDERQITNVGNFSSISIQMVFKRSIVYFLISMYLPANLIVFISWVGFWITRESVPARAGIGVTTILAMITLDLSIMWNGPKSSNVNAIEIYFGICFIFVFAALVEFSVVNYYDRDDRKYDIDGDYLIDKEKDSKSIDKDLNDKIAKNAIATKFIEALRNSNDIETIKVVEVSKIDAKARYLFPIVYFCCNIVYWMMYLFILPALQ